MRHVLFLTLFLTACGDERAVTDGGAGTDAGSDAALADSGMDAAVSSDAGASADAGTALDGGTAVDAGSFDDAGPSLDAATEDAGATTRDAGMCDTAAIRFIPPAGADFQVGSFCDVVEVCVSSDEEESAIRNASSEFTCGADIGTSCARACVWNGVYEVDASEYGEVCAVSVLSPQPDIVCITFL